MDVRFTNSTEDRLNILLTAAKNFPSAITALIGQYYPMFQIQVGVWAGPWDVVGGYLGSELWGDQKALNRKFPASHYLLFLQIMIPNILMLKTTLDYHPSQ